jgi:hypothetical protein
VLALGTELTTQQGGFSLEGLHVEMQMMFDNIHRFLGIQDMSVRLYYPKVEVNGKVVLELNSDQKAQLIRLDVPGQGRYALSIYPIDGWQALTTVSGKERTMEFQDGNAHVRIQQQTFRFLPNPNRFVYVYRAPGFTPR